jgi:hypothetical protein
MRMRARMENRVAAWRTSSDRVPIPSTYFHNLERGVVSSCYWNFVFGESKLRGGSSFRFSPQTTETAQGRFQIWRVQGLVQGGFPHLGAETAEREVVKRNPSKRA